MPRVCLICTHSDRALIEQGMIDNVPYRNIAKQFGISKPSISRHKKHMGQALAKSKDAKEIANGDRLIKQLEHLQSKTIDILNQAEEQADRRTALSAIREARGNIELIAKLLGELRESQVININPQWIELRTLIIRALEPYPEAKSNVVKALEGIDVSNG
jgi:hypothetical protein